MRVFDLRNPGCSLLTEERCDDHTLALMAPEGTYLFRWGEDYGRLPWAEVETLLKARLEASRFQLGLCDITIAVGGTPEVILSSAVLDKPGSCLSATCVEVERRHLAPPSSPVTVTYPGGYKEELGPLGDIHALEDSGLRVGY